MVKSNLVKEEYVEKVKSNIIPAISSLVYSEYGKVAYYLNVLFDKQTLIIFDDDVDYYTKVEQEIVIIHNLTGNIAVDCVEITEIFELKIKGD